MSPPPPPFGKRNLSHRAAGTGSVAAHEGSSPLDHAAFFGEVHRDLDAGNGQLLVVPDSLRAAMLTGLVVGSGLVGLDVTGIGNTFRPLSEIIALDPRAAAALPFMMILGLIGGGRAAATSLLIAHTALKRVKQTTHLAYAAGGLAAAMGFAGIMYALRGETPTHGWLIDALAGSAGGLFYRLFAGTRQAPG